MIVIGCGQRGSTYARFAAENPSKVSLIGAVDPRPHRLELLKTNQKLRIQLDERLIFDDWKHLLDFNEKVADAVVISTPDRTHAEIAVNCARLKYHILLEKPMATTAEDCKNIVKEIKENQCILAVCHVLRYTPYSRKIKELVSSGILGDIINIQHLEPVGFYHFAHSYVRGNWKNEKDSSFSLLAKSCHDIDWIRWIMNKRCSKISSLGSLKHFKKENKPVGAASRCLDCKVSKECPYSAQSIYLDLVKMGYTHWPVEVIVDGPVNLESVTKALREGPYGRCVYESDNDVVDNQVVNIQFEDGSTASFSMIAFTKELCVRKTRIFGSLGELECDGRVIKHFDFLTQQTATHIPNHDVTVNTSLTNHDYGDYYIIKDFVEAVAHDQQSLIVSGPDETLESHLMVFKAEQSRRESNVHDFEW